MDESKKSSWISTKCQNLEPCRSWIALTAAFLAVMVITLVDSFGVYYSALVDKYKSSKAQVGWVLSIRWIFVFVAGLFISPLMEKYGCRPVALFFALIYALGTTLSAIAPNVPSLYFLYGFLTGCGDCATYLTAVTSVEQLFSANRGFATCILAMGSPLGVLIHPLHTQYFLDLYGVTGLFLIHGGISLHLIIFALAFNTRSQKKQSKREEHVIGEKSGDSSKTEKTSTWSEKEEAKGNNGDVNSDLPQLYHTKNASARTEEVASSEKQTKCFCVKEYFSGVADFKVLRNISLVLVIIHFSLLWMVRLGILTHFVDCAKFRGLPDDKGSYLLSLSGAINLVMTIVSAVIMNTSWSNPALYSGFASLCFAASAFGCAFSNSLATFLATAVLTGVADGIALANLPLLTLYVVGLEDFPRGMAVMWTLLGPSAGASALVGWMVDMLKSYTIAFVILGVCGTVSAVLALWITIRETKKRFKVEDSSTPIAVISEASIVTRL